LPAQGGDTLADWWRRWVTGPPDRWVQLSLLVALVLLSPSSSRQDVLVGHMIALGTILGVSLRWRVAPLAALALLVVGLDLREVYFGSGFSDVLVVTRAAIEQVLAGGSPYGAGFEASVPPGGSYPYGPLPLLWYLPTLEDPRQMEMAVATLILALLALRGHLLGLAIYACTPILIGLTSDGSNDTSAGLLLLGAMALLPRLPRAGALMLGLAIAFKPHALAWVPPLVVWAGWPVILPLVLGAGLFWIPALIAWGPGAVLESIRISDRIHDAPYYSLGQALRRFGFAPPADLLNLFRFVAGGLTALVVMLRVRSADGVIIGGTLIFLVTLYSSFWSTFAYFAAIAPFICWHLDRWLGRARSRAVWPYDPVGALTKAVDGRWPAVTPGHRHAPAD
jgi:hypothetical protein